MAANIKDIQLRELKDTIKELNKTISSLNAVIKQLTDANTIQEEKIKYLESKIYSSSSERRSRSDDIPGQLSLDLPIFNEAEKTLDIEEKTIVKEHTRKKKITNKDKFENLPHEEVIHDLPEGERICSSCGTEMVPVGKKFIRSEVEYIPAVIKVKDHYQMTYECPKCKNTDKPEFKSAKVPEPLINNSFASESLVAWIDYQKFANALPFYRQEKDFHQLGLDLSRSTMANWVNTVSQTYFKPMYDFYHRELIKHKFLMADETRVQVLKEEGRKPQQVSYMWLYRTGEDNKHPIVMYNYTATRAGANAAEFLKGFEGYLETDGYQGYNKVKGITRCSCWAHCRRYFFDAIPKGHEKDLKESAVQAVIYIDKLFEAERQVNEKMQRSFKERKDLRIKYKEPEIIEAFYNWLRKVEATPGTKLCNAVTYTLNREEGLKNYLKDGRCSISNNLSENAIRPFTIGRKNWLFSDTPSGAESSAITYTMEGHSCII